MAQTNEELVKSAKEKLQFKSYDEGLENVNKLKADQEKHLQEMKDENGNFKATTAEQREQLAKRNIDIAANRAWLAEQGEYKQMEEAAKRGDTPVGEQYSRLGGAFGGGQMNPSQFKTIGQRLVESNEYKAHKGKHSKSTQYTVSFEESYGALEYKASQMADEYKSAVVENTMFAPPNYRIPLTVTSAQRPPILQDYIPTIQTSERNAVPYMLETTFTNNAAFAAQTTAIGTSDVRYTQQTQNIETLGTYIPVTEQMMEDVPLIQGLLNARISLMMGQTLETELISGSGSTPHLKGYLNAASIQHQAKGSDDIYTALAKGSNLVRWTGYVEPDYYVMHSTDFLTVRTTKDSLGNFIFGKPNEQVNEAIWGLPIIITNGITQGTALVGAFRSMSARYIARGMTLEVGRINDNFVTLEWAIRATQREGLVVNRGTAFCYVDGL